MAPERGVTHRCIMVRIMWCDAAGIRRCRVVPRSKLEDALRSGVGLARACLFLPSWGDCPPADPVAAPVGEVRLVPDLATLRMLPWNPTHGMAHAVLCTSPAQPWACCPRTALRRALALLLKETGLGLQVGFEVEFTLLHKPEPSLAGGMQALRPVDAAVYCQTTAYDAVSPVLDEMCAALEAMGDTIEQVHAESGHGQFEVVTRCAEAESAADALVMRKEALAGVAARHGLVASFLPKLFADQAGSGCHCHFSLTAAAPGRDGMADAARPHGLSAQGEAFAAGVLRHLPAVLAFTAASPNSYRRIAPSTWSGAYQCWGVNNREAPLRLVGAAAHAGTLNFELKCFDATANPYLGLVGVIAAGLLGIREGLQLPPPVGVDPAVLTEAERLDLDAPRLPDTLEASVCAAEEDAALVGVINEAVGGPDLVRAYFAVKRSEHGAFAAMTLEQEVLTLYGRY